MLNRLGVRGRLLIAFFGISAFAVLAAAAAMYSFLEVGKALDKITQQRVPSALSSLEISRQAERIVAVAPALLTVSTPTQREQLSAKIAAEIERLDALLSNLQGSSNAAVLELIERDAAQLRANLDALDALVAGRLEAGEHKSELLSRLLRTLNAAQRLITPGLMVVEGDLSQLQRVLDAPDLSSEARIASVSGLVSSIATSPPLQRAQIETLSINDTLLRIASAPRPVEVEILAFPVRRALGVLENLAAGIGPTLRARLLARLKEYRDLVDGPDSILQAREDEFAIVADSERLLGENAALSGELTEAVSLLVAGAKTDIRNANLDALSVQRLSTGVLVAVVALSLISSTLIVWLYVGRNLIARLTALSGSMLA
ncbi:MAG: guanylyl cyclase, partial [Gammaproteobacteria bacterium]|nr:guanylyl cyclase [Gammaproteobacteria bacterium]